MNKYLLFLGGIFAFEPLYAINNEMHNKDYNNLQTVSSNIIFNKDEILNHGLLINRSNVTVDCNGATIDGGNKLPYGVVIDSNGKNIDNIVVKNCNIKNFTKNGIYVGWLIGDNLKSNISKDLIYKLHPTNVLLTNNNVFNNPANGIYIDDHVSFSKIQNSKIFNNGGVGIYLEFSSKSNEVVNNKIYNNGYGNYGKREGVAIDGSYLNKVHNNTIFGNAAGGIFLYKNCQEHSTYKYSAVRKDGASFNSIENNIINNENVGIWIASRQSKNLQAQKCGDKPMYKNIYYEDFANDNQVSGNTFCKVSRGIVVEGDDNKVINNKFSGDVKKDIDLPVTARQKYLNRPQIGNVIKNSLSVSGCEK